MYDYRFKDAKNLQGLRYRNPETGDLEQFCPHSFIICPKFEEDIIYYSNLIPCKQTIFRGFEGTCEWCGEIVTIFEENLKKNGKEHDKYLEKVLQQMEKEKKENK